MKKQLLTICTAVFVWACSHAQITITQADLPSINSVFIQRFDTLFTGSPGTSGANQTWNFGSLLNHGQDTTGFISPTLTPGAMYFPSANLCIANTVDNIYVYFLKSATEFSVLGYYGDFGFGPNAYPFNPAQKLLTLPSTFNTNFTNSSLQVIQGPFNSPPIDSIRVKRRIVQNSTIDGWGSLTTPTGTFNTIRQNLYELTYDSLFTRQFGVWTFFSVEVDTSRYFRWWANGRGIFELEIVQIGANPVTYSSTYLHQTTVGVNEAENNDLFVFSYPNPAVNEVNFMTRNKTGYSIQIFDITGKHIATKQINSDITQFDVSAYHAGNYIYTLNSPDGKTVLNGKFTVSK